MSVSKKQSELDLKKWYESENAGYDLCGEFDFCSKCDKAIENPCAAAYEVYHSPKPNKKAACKKTAKK